MPKTGGAARCTRRGCCRAQVLTIAPDDTTVMTVPWPSDTPVLRQDGATHPGSYIGAFHPDE